MEYWLLIFLLIFLFVIYMQISALSNSVKYIREEIGRLRNELAPRLPEPTVATVVATVKEEITPTNLADDVAASEVWTLITQPIRIIYSPNSKARLKRWL